MNYNNAMTSVLLLFLGACLMSSNAYSQSCPSDAICRYDESPGRYNGNGPYNVDDYDMPFGSTPGGASVYYPTNATPPYAVLVFTPPLTGSQIMYRAWGPFFASHGIVMVTMDTRTTSDSVNSRADQQADVLDAMKDENSRYGSPLRGKIDTSRLGAVGWSMGGGATWINSAEYNGLKTAMSLAGHNLTSSNSNSRGRNTRVPILIMNGAQDSTILGGLGQSDGVYDNVPSGVPKVFYEVRYAGHFDWGSPTAASDEAAEIALAFQKTFLEGDTRWARFITRPTLGASEWETSNIPN